MKRKTLPMMLLFGSIMLFGINNVEASVAEINGHYYDSVTEALNTIEDSSKTTIKIVSDYSEAITIPSDRNIVLDLQSYTLSNSGNNAVITNNGKLEVKNGTIRSGAATGAINNNSTGNLTISSGTIKTTGTKQGLYNNGGIATITGSTRIESSSSQRAAVHNLKSGKLNITGGTIISTGAYAVYNEAGTLNIGTKDD